MKLYIFDLDDTLYDRTSQLSELDMKKVKSIFPFTDAILLLKSLTGIKALVTKVKHSVEFQKAKIEALKIGSYFNKILFIKSDEEKQVSFQSLMKEYLITPNNTIIIGDRIDSEIRYGKILGCKTILLKHGKYSSLKPKDNFEIPDFTISSLKEILSLNL